MGPHEGFLRRVQVRCVECKTDPITPGHFCECCGRKLSLHERGALDTAAHTTAPVSRPNDQMGSISVCGSCGGHTDDGDLCASCQRTYGPLLSASIPKTAAYAPVTPSEIASVPTSRSTAATSAHSSDNSATASTQSAPRSPISSEVPPSSSARRETTVAAVTTKADAQPRKPSPPKAPKPAPVTRRASNPDQRRLPFKSMIVTAAAVFTLIVIGGKWYESKRLEETGGKEPPPAAAETVTAERQAPKPRAAAAKPTKAAPTLSPARPQRTTSARSRSATPPAKPVRPSKSFTEEAAPALASRAVTEPAAPPVASVAAEPARTEAPEAPVGRIFEPTDVDESPQVVSRVEPQLPLDVPGRMNDVVVVRVLVSQSGHPFRVSLLRKSRAGRPLDDAVVAAVTRWTFSPARKKGEPVSCWYNIGVPLGGAD